MGEAVTALSGSGLLAGNPASVKMEEYLSSYAYVPGVSGLNHMGFAGHWSVKSFFLETGVQRLGNLTASIDRVYSGFATQKGHTSLGVRINLHQFKALPYPTDFNFSFSLGGITRLSQTLSFGAWIDNLSVKANLVQEGFVPVRMEAGFRFDLSKALITVVSVSHQLNEQPILRSGLEYGLSDKVKLRFGTSSFPVGMFYGAGFRYWKVVIDLAASWRKHEGSAFQATASYRISSR